MRLFFQWLVVVSLMLLVHKDVYTIPFHYTEIYGIQRNRVVRDLENFRERMLTAKGLLQRPLSVLSYAANHAWGGDDPRSYHAVNLAIHGANVGLVMLLARQLALPAFFAGATFALHPLATACVSQIFGRNYSLASTFCFLAFYLFLRWRDRPRMSCYQLTAIGGLLVLGTLTKQSLVFFPMILLWTEVSIGKKEPLGRAVRTAVFGSWRVQAVILLVLVGGLGLLLLYAVPGSRTAPVSLWTYFVSQLAASPILARFYLLPYQTALTHDLPFYRSVLHPDVWVGSVVVAAAIVVALRWRSHALGFLLGALLISLIPTNTVLPKIEIIREWRLYPSLFFFSLCVGAALHAVVGQLREASRSRFLTALYACFALYLASFAHSDLEQNRRYQTGVDAWKQVLQRYPRSANALNNVGFHYYLRRDYAQARDYYERAVQEDPKVYIFRENLARAYARLGDTERAKSALREAKALRSSGRTDSRNVRFE